jgi:hypothetical protein
VASCALGSVSHQVRSGASERKPGRSKLVYDKTRRTIVAVAEGSQAPQALNITADDADMFSVVTLSAEWLRERWPELKKAGLLPVTFSSWDDGDALTQSELCVQSTPTIVEGSLLLGQAASANTPHDRPRNPTRVSSCRSSLSPHAAPLARRTAEL